MNFCRLWSLAWLLGVLVFSLGVHAVEIQVVKATDILQKKANKVQRVAKVSPGRKFQSDGKVSGGKFYRIRIKGKEAFILASAVKELSSKEGSNESAEDFSSSSKKLGGSQFEFGAAFSEAIGLGPNLAYFYSIPLSSKMTVDLGAVASIYLLNPYLKQNLFSGAARLSFHGKSMSIGPEVNFNFGMNRPVDGISSTSTSLGFGVVSAFSMGQSFALVPIFRFGFSGGFSWTALIDGRISF